MALERGELEWAVVPIENSLEGSINVTLDLLAEDARDLEIVGEALLRVRHSLIAAEALELGEIEEVITHPQVPGQCALFLRSELPHARIVPAARPPRPCAWSRRGSPAGERRGRAAIGTLLAARSTAARSSEREWRIATTTKRVSCGLPGRGRSRRRRAHPPPLRARAAGEWKTSLVFWGPGAERPGWLVRCLDEFARRDINLTKIESRPRRERLGSYMFFVDLNGSQRTPQSPTRSPGCGRCASRCGCWAPTSPHSRPSRIDRRLSRSATRSQRPRYTAARGWKVQSHQSRWGPCRLPSTSGADLGHRPQRRWVAGCSF